MAITYSGLFSIIECLHDAPSTVYFTQDNAYIGVGDSTSAFAATQIDLQGTNKVRSNCSTISTSTNVLTAEASFGPTIANFNWQEWGLFNASTSGSMLNRSIANNGIKVNGQTWNVTITITLTVS